MTNVIENIKIVVQGIIWIAAGWVTWRIIKTWLKERDKKPVKRARSI